MGRVGWVVCGGRGGEQSSSSVYDSVISTRIFKEVEVVEGGKGVGVILTLFFLHPGVTQRKGWESC